MQPKRQHRNLRDIRKDLGRAATRLIGLHHDHNALDLTWDRGSTHQPRIIAPRARACSISEFRSSVDRSKLPALLRRVESGAAAASDDASARSRYSSLGATSMPRPNSTSSRSAMSGSVTPALSSCRTAYSAKGTPNSSVARYSLAEAAWFSCENSAALPPAMASA